MAGDLYGCLRTLALSLISSSCRRWSACGGDARTVTHRVNERIILAAYQGLDSLDVVLGGALAGAPTELIDCTHSAAGGTAKTAAEVSPTTRDLQDRNE